jgi:hypothetical protein
MDFTRSGSARLFGIDVVPLAMIAGLWPRARAA